MSIKEKIKFFSQKQLIKTILKLLSRSSEKSLLKAIHLAKLFIPKDLNDIRRQANGLEEVIQKGHPAVQLYKRLIKNLSRNCFSKLVENFFINACLQGNTKRFNYQQKYGVIPPWLFVMSPTMRCNLNCVGCSTREYNKATDLPFSLMDRVMNEAKQMGIYFVTTQGGEMFVREDMFDFYKKHSDVYFQVYTNGTLIDKKMAKRIERLGNIAPAISLEGFEKETDERRGKGVFNKVMRAMDNLKETGVMFGFSVTVTRNNVDVITSDEFFEMLIEKGCYFGWYFLYIPIGRNPDLSLMATPHQRQKVREKIEKVRETSPIFIGDFWNDGPAVGGCIAGGRRYFHINNKGDIEPCAFFHYAVDNIKNKTLAEALNSNFFKAIRKRQQSDEAAEPYSRNLLTPCCIIDQPWILRDTVKEFKAYSTDGTNTLFNEKITKGLDEYSKVLHQITDPIWEQKKQKKNSSQKSHEKINSFHSMPSQP